MNGRKSSGFDASTPNVARIYDYMLGGKDNFAADREAAERVLQAFPESRQGVRVNRQFLGNVVRHLAGEAGIRQFLDIGAGLPTQDNVHQVAHSADPEARTVYIDNDPVVCVHGRALLAKTPAVAMIEGDLRRPEEIWAAAVDTGLIDPGEPVALLLVAILHFLDDPYAEVAKLRELMAPGSHLVITHLTSTKARDTDIDEIRRIYAGTGSGVVSRSIDEIKEFFGDFELLDGGRFISPLAIKRFEVLGWGGVGRKV
ncbi:SAM-dependent methyltransferase [Streptosporangium sp. NPDC051023]|uniref:SAM-dependent methyltransferase n=1 Tax=Streptosporangium sp. NPDC051023 TaxID=3155410 RepID=UPI00344F2993